MSSFLYNLSPLRCNCGLYVLNIYYSFSFFKLKRLLWNHDPCSACRQRIRRWTFRHDILLQGRCCLFLIMFYWTFIFFWCIQFPGRCCQNFRTVLFGNFSIIPLIKSIKRNIFFSFSLFPFLYFIFNVTPEFPPIPCGFGFCLEGQKLGVLQVVLQPVVPILNASCFL